jgi:hypothetical protein
LQKGIDAIPQGGRAFISYSDLRRVTGQSCEEFVAERAKFTGSSPNPLRLEQDDREQRLYFLRAKLN